MNVKQNNKECEFMVIQRVNIITMYIWNYHIKGNIETMQNYANALRKSYKLIRRTRDKSSVFKMIIVMLSYMLAFCLKSLSNLNRIICSILYLKSYKTIVAFRTIISICIQWQCMPIRVINPFPDRAAKFAWHHAKTSLSF